MRRVMQIGHMGRDAAAGQRLVEEGCSLFPVMQHANPSLTDLAMRSGGTIYQLPDICDVNSIAEFADDIRPDLVYVNSDFALAADVVGAIRRRQPEILSASPDKNSSQIEWDKLYARKIVAEINHDFNPLFIAATRRLDVAPAINFFEDLGIPVAIKPFGLTGGKGVKVMGHQLQDYQEATRYSLSVIDDPAQEGVLIEEALSGHEFNLEAYTDGKTLVFPPATYDYSYREDGDTGPGTGGTGCFTMPNGEPLPFIGPNDYSDAAALMQQVLERLKRDGKNFKGTLYGSFMKTPEGLKLIEFNGRIGDPEGVSIVELIDESVDFFNILTQIANNELKPGSIKFKKLASAVIYLVSPDYAYRERGQYFFELDPAIIAGEDCRTYFASAEKLAHNKYRTVGSSRVVALASLDKTPWDARAKIHEAISKGTRGPLEFRRDIADKDYITRLGL